MNLFTNPEVTARYFATVEEVGAWSKKNFGDQISKQDGRKLNELAPLLGLMEEASEHCNAANDEEEIDALGDLHIFACDFIYRSGIKPHLKHEPEEKGISAAIGSICHIVLKHHQAIRGLGNKEMYQLRLSCALHNLLYAIEYEVEWLCGVKDQPFTALYKVWETVKQRDWTKNPQNAQ